MYTLEYISPWTSYIVDVYPSVMACEQDCEQRFDVVGLRFKRDETGLLTASLSFEDDVMLKLYEGKDASTGGNGQL